MVEDQASSAVVTAPREPETASDQVLPSDLSIQVGGQPSAAETSRSATSWHGLDSVEYMNSGDYHSNHQFSAEHASFLPYTVSSEQGQGGVAGQPSGSDGMASSSDLFGGATSGFAHVSQLSGALGTKEHFGSAGLSVPLPTPPDSNRKPQSRQLASIDMDLDRTAGACKGVDQTKRGGDGGEDRNSAVIATATATTSSLRSGDPRRYPLQGLPDGHARADAMMPDAMELESSSPLGMIHRRMLMQQGSPSPGQRAASHSTKGNGNGNGTDAADREGGAKSFVPYHRPTQSLGQAGSIMSGNLTDGASMRTEHMHISAPVSPIEATSHGTFLPLVQFGTAQQQQHHHHHHHHQRQHQQPQQLSQRNAQQAMLGHGHPVSPGMLQQAHGHTHSQGHHQQHQYQHEQSRQLSGHSMRSISPSNSIASTSMTSMTSMSGQHAHCSISPLGSARFQPDASFGSQDTSTDSISNAPSTCVSRASSTSDELMSHDFGSGCVPASMRMSKRKRKLLNLDRKLICDFQLANPDAKQDAIAAKFGIERSTVSKILKQKHKWLAIDPASETAKIAKHRTAKFPKVEDRLTEWVARAKEEGKPVHDMTIRQEALRIAKEIGLTVDKFKASGGWIEKFRERNQLPKSNALPDMDVSTSASPSGSKLATPDNAEAGPGAEAAPGVAGGEADRDVASSTLKREQDSQDDNATAATGSSSVAASGTGTGTITSSPTSELLMLPPDGAGAAASLTTPTSNSKRQYVTMASASAGSDHHVSPLHGNLARMQFSQHAAAEAMQSGMASDLAQHIADQQQHQQQQQHGRHHNFHFEQPHGMQPQLNAMFGGDRNFVGGAGVLHSPHSDPFLLSMQTAAAVAAEGDAASGGAAKRRRAGTEAELLGPAFGSERQDARAAMNAFQFPATPDNGARLRQGTSHGRLNVESINGPLAQQAERTSVAPLDARIGDGMVNVGTSTARSRKASQTSKPRRKASTSPVKRSARKSHLPGASSPLTRSSHGIVGTIEDEVVENAAGGSGSGSNDEAPAAAHSPITPSLPRAADAEQSVVTAEQAQQSLDLVLRFLDEQSSNFVPTSHFVVFGHLQANIEQLIRDRSAAAEGAGPALPLTTASSRPASPSTVTGSGQ